MGEDTKYCGHCKREVSSINFTIHAVHCQRNIAICSMCNEPVPRSHYQQHIETSHKSIPCPKCSLKIEPLKIFTHEKEHCPKRMVSCEHCELEVTAAEHEKHKEYCEARTERCKGCTKYVQVRYLQFHYETDHKYLKPEDKARADENSDDESSECPICLGPVTLPLALDCGHIFCMVCVKGIANTTKNCAICRRDITRDMLMDIRFCREEDIIKNYVNKPREKKTVRSHSVPSRGTGPGGRRLVHHTTEDYDEMVSALMSSRSTTPSYRYQRPSNTNILPSYTPYSSTTPSTSDSCKDTCKDSCKDSYKDSSESCKDSFQEDDCCSSSRSPSSNSQTTTTNSISNSVSSSSTSPASTTISTQRASRDSLSRTAVSPSSYSAPPIRSSSASRAITSYSSRSITAPSRTSTSSNSTSMSSSKASTFSTSSASSTTTSSSSASSSNKTSCTSSTASVPSSTTTSSYSSSYSNGARPRRPTTLALETNAVLTTLAAQTSSSNSRLSGSRSAEPPANATQEQYDRWLAFQLAKADDDLPPSEFNRKHKPAFRRSFSMPERPDNVSDSSSSSDSDSDTPSSRGSSRRPPASPRNTTTSSSASSSTRSTPISKSSSDSNASSSCGTGNNGSALSTGARPKSSGLRKRVSFKEDAPPIRREAPVLLPCEFCDEMFPERDLMRHQTSCEHNETQLPRSSRLAQLAAVNSNSASTVNLTSTSSNTNVRVTSASSATINTQSTSTENEMGPSSQQPRRRHGRITTPVCMPPQKAIVPNASPATERKLEESSYVPVRKSPCPIPRRTTAQNRNQEPPTTSPPPSCPSSISPPPVSPPPTTTITIVDQPPAVVVSPNLSSGSSRPFSISPASSTSTNNSSVSSGSLSSSSTTPSTSSSASPVPVNLPNPDIAPPDTPTTDIELDYDEDIPFSRPRKGRLLSSAIFSWRSISGSAATRRGSYARSNTAPLEDTNTNDSPQPLQPVTTSKSATQLPSQPSPEIESPSSYPMISRSPSPSKRQLKQISLPPQSEIMKEQQVKDISLPSMNSSTAEHSEIVFVKNPNKYKAPPPPQPPTEGISLSTTQSVIISHCKDLSNTTPPSNSHSTNIITHEKTAVNSQSITENVKQGYVSKGHSHEQNGYIKFDSKPMMNSFVQKEAELRINCEFCKQVFTPERFRCHQTVCEAALRPVSRRASTPVNQSPPQKSKSPIPAKHNKGPAPPPPPAADEPVPPECPAKDSSANKRLERSHSVKDERTSYRVTRRLERASSIKESRTTNSYVNKSSFNRWGSRDCIYSNGIDSPTSYSSTGWSGSTSNIYGGWTGNGSHAWSSHINMVRDDLRHRAAASSVNALSQDNGGDSDNGGENEVDTEGNGRDSRSSRTNSCNSLLVEVRAALNKTSPSHFAVDTGGARYRERSSSRTRPISMYNMSSGSWGSMYDLSSPSRTFNISDAFSTASLASKRRYIR